MTSPLLLSCSPSCFQFGIWGYFLLFCIWTSVALNAMRLIADQNHVLQGYLHDSIWTHICEICFEPCRKPHPSTSSLGGTQMENVRYFWHLYRKILLQIVHLSFSWRLFVLFCLQRNERFELLGGERLQTMECDEPVGMLLYLKHNILCLFYQLSTDLE